MLYTATKAVVLLLKIFDVLAKKKVVREILNRVEVPGFVVSAQSHLRLRRMIHLRAKVPR